MDNNQLLIIKVKKLPYVSPPYHSMELPNNNRVKK
jgi:hypothetical protein